MNTYMTTNKITKMKWMCLYSRALCIWYNTENENLPIQNLHMNGHCNIINCSQKIKII